MGWVGTLFTLTLLFLKLLVRSASPFNVFGNLLVPGDPYGKGGHLCINHSRQQDHQ